MPRPRSPIGKPRLRGLLHLYAFCASVPALTALLLASGTARATIAATIYGLSLVALFGVSALFHRVTWSPRARRWMGRLDHAMINLLIAGTFTPLGLLVLSGTFATIFLALVWGGALAGTLLHGLWIDAPKRLSAVVYVALGSSGIAAVPDLLSHVGWAPTALLALGGALYSMGAAVYAFRRPDPAPDVFGYHEVFHALVVAAAVTHYAVVALYVLPGA
jgi:hemolysin III